MKKALIMLAIDYSFYVSYEKDAVESQYQSEEEKSKTYNVSICHIRLFPATYFEQPNESVYSIAYIQGQHTEKDSLCSYH